MEGRIVGNRIVFINSALYAYFAGMVLAYASTENGVLKNTKIDPLIMAGVGIGAALLAPAVNCGMYLANEEYIEAANSLGGTGTNIACIFLGYMSYWLLFMK